VAAYKALALKFHPDRGGTGEDFQRIQRAFDELKAKNKA
jgi:curved DNA-binding protein CbpA